MATMHDPAALVGRIGVGLGEDGVVVVARVGRIDGDERKRRADPCGPASVGGVKVLAISAMHALGEVVGDAVRVHGDEADLALVVAGCRALSRMRACGTCEAPLAREIEAHEIAVLGAALVALADRPGAQLLAVDGLDACRRLAVRAEDAEQAALLARQPLDRRGLEAVAVDVGLFAAR